jgi:uncharacterized OB-fold protein
VSGSAYTKPLPKIDALGAPFWEGTRAGELRVQRCTDCGTLAFPPARHCAACLGERREWVRVSGRGTVATFGIFHRLYFPAFERDLPYNVALVRLDEGPRMYTNLVGIRNEDIAIGMRVRARFEAVTDEVTLVKFEPDPANGTEDGR